MTFGEKLQLLLEERDLSQKQLSDALNLHDSTVRNYVRGLREPDYNTLKMIAEYFEVSIDYLLSYSKPLGNITDEEFDFIRVLRQLTAEQRKVYFQQGRAFVALNAQKKKSSMPTLEEDKAG